MDCLYKSLTDKSFFSLTFFLESPVEQYEPQQQMDPLQKIHHLLSCPLLENTVKIHLPTLTNVQGLTPECYAYPQPYHLRMGIEQSSYSPLY